MEHTYVGYSAQTRAFYTSNDDILHALGIFSVMHTSFWQNIRHRCALEARNLPREPMAMRSDFIASRIPAVLCDCIS